MTLITWADRAAFWRLWRLLGKAVWAVWQHMIADRHLDSHAKGVRWEKEFRAAAEERGLVVGKGAGRADLCVAGRQVQCKWIDRLDGVSIDVANMRPVAANGGLRGYLRSEVDVLALRHRGGTYLIPGDELLGRDGIRLRGRVKVVEIERHRDDWSVFDGEPPAPRPEQQHRMF